MYHTGKSSAANDGIQPRKKGQEFTESGSMKAMRNCRESVLSYPLSATMDLL